MTNSNSNSNSNTRSPYALIPNHSWGIIDTVHTTGGSRLAVIRSAGYGKYSDEIVVSETLELDPQDRLTALTDAMLRIRFNRPDLFAHLNEESAQYSEVLAEFADQIGITIL